MASVDVGVGGEIGESTGEIADGDILKDGESLVRLCLTTANSLMFVFSVEQYDTRGNKGSK